MKSIRRTESVTEETMLAKIEQLSNEKKIILQDGNVYLRSLYYAEDQFSSHVKRILDKEIETKRKKSLVMDKNSLKRLNEQFIPN